MIALTSLAGHALTLALAGVPSPTPEGVYLQEHLGATVPHDVTLTDHRGRTTTTGALFDGDRPVVLVLAYYRCPMLCGLTINGLAASIGQLDGALAGEYELVTLSFDPRDGHADAERARATALEAAELPTSSEVWPFMTAEPDEVARVAEALGFGYAYDERTDQYGHPAVVFVLSPEGTITRYLYGFEHPPLDLRLALVEAGRGQVGTLVEQALITCYRYDPTVRRYGFHLFSFVRIMGGLILLVVGTGLFVMVRRDLRRSRQERVERPNEGGSP